MTWIRHRVLVYLQPRDCSPRRAVTQAAFDHKLRYTLTILAASILAE